MSKTKELELPSLDTRIRLVKEDGLYLALILHSEQTYEICLEAVKTAPEALHFVREDFLTPELIANAYVIDNTIMDNFGIEMTEEIEREILMISV